MPGQGSGPSTCVLGLVTRGGIRDPGTLIPQGSLVPRACWVEVVVGTSTAVPAVTPHCMRTG